MATTIDALIEAIGHEAAREPIPLDLPVYSRAQRDPLTPILYTGSLDAPVCFLGRDLGKDEVRLGQPLVGAGGRLVRQGILRAHQVEAGHVGQTDGNLEAALRFALLTNTVPYKPPGNKAYSEPIKRRFRPFVVELLTRFWSGHHILTLGSEAFRWFEPYGDPSAFEAVAQTGARFESSFSCRLPIAGSENAGSSGKTVQVHPLPHPSPLNQRWHKEFPNMLGRRLSAILGSPEGDRP
ncbi:MAG: uracil-DNA glycosylase family protein [Isosphaeraceae bacterium]